MSKLHWMAPIVMLIGFSSPASADVITDWNEKAVALISKHRMLPPQAERVIACVHVAMFDAVNSIERRYQRPAETRRDAQCFSRVRKSFVVATTSKLSAARVYSIRAALIAFLSISNLSFAASS